MYSHLITTYLVLAAVAAGQSVPNSAFNLHPLIGTGSRGDGAAASEALLESPSGLAEDKSGNIYISEAGAGVIRKVRSEGVIERFAGTGTPADGPAGGSATETDLLAPSVLLADPDGGLLFADDSTCRIRKVRTDGVLVDIAGTGSCNGMGGGVPGGGGGTSRDHLALETDITSIGGMAWDSSGRLVFTETTRHVIRRLDTDGYIRTIAGSSGYAGYSGDDGDASSAVLSYPAGLALDVGGNLLFGDGHNCRVRKISTDGVITTLAGATQCATAGALYTGSAQTRLEYVGTLAYDAAANVLYIGLPRVYRVVKFDMNASRVTPFLGNGQAGATRTSQPLSLTLNEPTAILASSRAGVLVASARSFQVYSVQNGAVKSFAGYWPQLDTYPAASSTRLLRPSGVFRTSDGSLLVGDSGAGRLLRWDSPDQIAAVAGMRYPAGMTKNDSGAALEVTLARPNRVVRRQDGEVFFTEDTRIRAIDTNGVLRNIRTSLSGPAGLAFDSEDRLVFAESGEHRIVRLDLSANTSTVIAGTGTAGMSGDSGDATSAQLNSPGDVAFDSQGNLLVADRGNRRIRKIATDGTITTVIGSGLPFSYNDISGQDALKTGFDPVAGLACDEKGNIYVSEYRRVSMVTPDGRVHIVTGMRSEDDNGNRSYIDGPIAGAGALAVNPQGELYISVKDQGQVLVASPVNPGGQIPVISAGGVVNAASFTPGISPGSFASVFGTNLAGGDPSSARVILGGRLITPFFSSEGQVNFLVPEDVAEQTIDVRVSTAQGLSEPVAVTVLGLSPGIFFNTATGAGAVLLGPNSAYIEIYATGLGFLRTGPSGLLETVYPVEAVLGGQPAQVVFAGRAPGFAGLYQVNALVPAGMAGGVRTLSIQTKGQTSNEVTVQIP